VENHRPSNPARTDHAITDAPLDTIVDTVEVELEVQRSRFLAVLARIDDLEAGGALVDRRRRLHHDASHHGSAMVVGRHADRQRSNDDGEPAGTAGAPMLAVLVGSGLTDVAAVVTRWFGGTKLGAGGLVRAYGDAVRGAVTAAHRLQRIPVERIALHAGHHEAGRLEHLLRRRAEQGELVLDEPTYDAEGARFALAIPDDRPSGWLAELTAAAGPAVEVTPLGPAIREVRRRS
jgi:uncharacterized YigZ family protein